MFEIKNLSFKYEDWIFQETSCSSQKAKIGIIGVNGIGKTTLLRLIAGDLEPDSGTIETRMEAYLVDFSIKNYNRFTPRELFELCLSLKTFDSVFDSLVSTFEFEPMLDTCLGKLSLGNFKKAFLILAFATKQKMILLDEPFENLDEKSNQNLANYIKNCDKEIIVVSHNHKLLQSCVEELYEVTDKKLVKR